MSASMPYATTMNGMKPISTRASCHPIRKEIMRPVPRFPIISKVHPNVDFMA